MQTKQQKIHQVTNKYVKLAAQLRDTANKRRQEIEAIVNDQTHQPA